METNLSYTKKLTRYFCKKVTTDCCEPDETLADTKDCLRDTTEIMSKLIKVKFIKSPGISIIQQCHLDGLKTLTFFSGERFYRLEFHRGGPPGGFNGHWDRVCEESVKQIKNVNAIKKPKSKVILKCKSVNWELQVSQLWTDQTVSKLLT